MERHHTNYTGGVDTPAVDMMVATLLFNIDVSAKYAQITPMDISNIYLMIPFNRPEYIRITAFSTVNKVNLHTIFFTCSIKRLR